jgi:hypothetical protein
MVDMRDERLKDRLGWLSSAMDGLLRALGSDVIRAPAQLQRTVDPIKVLVIIQLNRFITKENREPLRTFMRCWAAKWDCDITRFLIDERSIKAEVLTKQRNFIRDAHGRFLTGKEEQ